LKIKAFQKRLSFFSWKAFLYTQQLVTSPPGGIGLIGTTNVFGSLVFFFNNHLAIHNGYVYLWFFIQFSQYISFNALIQSRSHCPSRTRYLSDIYISFCCLFFVDILQISFKVESILSSDENIAPGLFFRLTDK
jgi:hypothetical protein